MILRSLISLLMILVISSGSQAESRIALLIGNQAYTEKVGALKNPFNDIGLVGAALERVGFKVTQIKDADYKTIDTALKRHIQQIRRAGKNTISFVYYSGHGASDPDTETNYLIPVDVEGVDEASVWTNSIELGDVVNKLRDQSPLATHYVVFDACREELHLTREGKKAMGPERGFVAVGTVTGVMIAYATAPGRTASDVGQRGGPYAKALAEEIVKPGVEAVTMFRNVQLKVREAIGQDPWLSFPTLPPVYFAGKLPEGPSPERQIEIAFWESVKSKKDPAVLAAYLERYPKGEFAFTAQTLIAQYEQQLRAERAAREEENRRQDEVAWASMQEREEQLRNAGGVKTQGHAKQEQEEKTIDNTKRANELARVREEVRKAQEAVRVAVAERLAAVKAADEAKARAKVASLPANTEGRRFPEHMAENPIALARALQIELNRVGCDAGNTDGNWGAKAKDALEQFVRLSKSDIPTGDPSEKALQTVAARSEQVCPHNCKANERWVNGKCVVKRPHTSNVANRTSTGKAASNRGSSSK